MDPGTKLFELSWCFDEGYNGAEDLFWATSEIEVMTYILKEIQEFISFNEETLIKGTFKQQNGCHPGESYYNIINTIDSKLIHTSEGYRKISKAGFLHDDSQRKIFIDRLKTIKAAELLNIIEQSCVNGDSNAQVRIHIYNPQNIIQVPLKSSLDEDKNSDEDSDEDEDSDSDDEDEDSDDEDED